VLDLFGAVGDLGQRRIRVLHGLSLVDDPTRAFRAVRLAARLEFEIERRTAHAIELALGQGIFDRLSSTRLRREVELLLQAAEFPRSIRLAARYGLLQVLSQGLKLSARTRAGLERAAKAIAWYEELPRIEAFQRWLVPLCRLLAEAEPRVAGEVIERLRPGRRAAGVLGRCRESVSELIAVLTRRSRPSPSAVYSACKGLEVEILLTAIACAPRRGTRNAIRRHLEAQREIRLEIDGRDLLRAGVPAGRSVARGLQAALAAKLDGQAAEAAEQLRRALAAAEDPRDPA
jgi:tRNA nucleotidyltransferase (CCA-adding enzyme)